MLQTQQITGASILRSYSAPVTVSVHLLLRINAARAQELTSADKGAAARDPRPIHN